MSTAAPRTVNSVKNPQVFNSTARFLRGWYWVVETKNLKVGQVKPVRMLGRDLAVYRGEDGVAQVLDAYCPHMGAHLAEGKVQGTGLRCFFHDWKFERDGKNSDVPSLGHAVKACVKTWPTRERHGMVWMWTGDEPAGEVPAPPELFDERDDLDYSYGTPWVKNCHPNVVMVNAIDAHHFNTVHDLPAKIEFEMGEFRDGAMTFANTTRGGDDVFLLKLIRPLYAGPITYKLCYWYGSTGVVTVGPDMFHFYIMFCSRMIEDGKAEGRTVVVTKKRPGVLGWITNRIALWISKQVGNYFAKGDTQVFQTIRFDIQTPVQPDRSILQFVKHIEGQPTCEVGSWKRWDRPDDAMAPRDPEAPEAPGPCPADADSAAA